MNWLTLYDKYLLIDQTAWQLQQQCVCLCLEWFWRCTFVSLLFWKWTFFIGVLLLQSSNVCHCILLLPPNTVCVCIKYLRRWHTLDSRFIIKKSSNDIFLLLAILPFFAIFVHMLLFWDIIWGESINSTEQRSSDSSSLSLAFYWIWTSQFCGGAWVFWAYCSLK